jgi:hypothetical protein
LKLTFFTREILGSHGSKYEDENFWDMVLRSLIEVDQHFIIRLVMIEEVCTSETLVYFYETIWHISQNSGFHLVLELDYIFRN